MTGLARYYAKDFCLYMVRRIEANSNLDPSMKNEFIRMLYEELERIS